MVLWCFFIYHRYAHGEIMPSGILPELRSSTIQYNTIQYNTIQYNTTQHNATQRNATQRNATQRNATQRNATQRNATQRNATQRNATQLNAAQRNATQCNALFLYFGPAYNAVYMLGNGTVNISVYNIRKTVVMLFTICLSNSRTMETNVLTSNATRMCKEKKEGSKM